MKKVVLCGLMGIIFMLQSVLCVEAGGKDKVGATTAVFLNIAQGARPTGMGGAFVAGVDDVNACWWNPAGLIRIKSREILYVNTRWIEDVDGNFIAYAQPTTAYEGKKRVIAGSVILSNVSGIDGRDGNGATIGSLKVENRAIVFSTALGLTPATSIGVSLKAINQDLGGSKGETMAFDLGWLFAPRENLSFGANIQNIGPKLKTEDKSNDLPLNLKLGFCFKPTILGDNATAAIDVDVPMDNDVAVHGGVEYWASNAMCVRVGYERVSENRSGYSIGMGFKGSGEGMLKAINTQIDYAMLSYTDFDPTHRVSMITRF
ncbi:PorV/PorQ family protein [Candidatus Desantisbacteria bacterium]|nr:PorV/PorQ family protein [Candidatus Desantisbacteria bacterium]